MITLPLTVGQRVWVRLPSDDMAVHSARVEALPEGDVGEWTLTTLTVDGTPHPSVRHWIWVREFQADLGDGRSEPWRWRLFASRRGFVLEVEDKYRRPEGQALCKAGLQALDHFIRTWNGETK